MINNIIKTLKVNHYIKNIIVFIPIMFSLNVKNLHLWMNSLLIFIAFCLISSAVYIMNDIIDIEKDKLHPIKCNRPIASGKISKKRALSLMLLLIFCSFTILGQLNMLCLCMVLTYFVLNVLYSFYLKQLVLIDATCIAIGFILRVVAGCFAISVIPSALVILLTFFTSMFFTFTKRKLELDIAGKDKRESLMSFDSKIATQFILINATLSIAFYFTYVLDETTITKAGTPYLYLTVIPFALIIFRLLLLVNTTKIEDDPIRYIEQDKITKNLIVSYLIVLTLVLVF